MKSYLLLILVLALQLPPLSALAQSIKIDETFFFEIELPEEKWILSQKVPESLVIETADHLGHTLAAQGKSIDEDQLLQKAAVNLSANEAFIYNPHTLATLSIDFSALGNEEEPPSQKAVRLSAEFAGEGLKVEGGIAELEFEAVNINIEGADIAYRIDANYSHHGDPIKFVGVVGFAPPYWFYLYYKDRIKDASDFSSFESMLDTVELKRN